MVNPRFHVFGDDALGDYDAVAIAGLVRRGELSAAEVAAAARARTEQADPRLRGTTFLTDEPLPGADLEAPLYGVPTFVKDNADVAQMPTNHGTYAFVARPAAKHGAFTKQFLDTGVTVLGKSRLSEFGFNVTTEFEHAEPTRNPWHTDYSSGASTGGGAALVAAGAVPLAHANDGGGSIRIPAASCGLVGLKPTRGRHIDGEIARSLPLNIIGEGVVTRSVRDTAAYLAAAERYWRNPNLPPLGQIEGPANRRLRIGVLADSITGHATCPQTREVLAETVHRVEQLGHHVEPIEVAQFPIHRGFPEDFILYWGMLSALISTFGRYTMDRNFDKNKVDAFTVGLRRLYRSSMHKTPGALYRLSRARRDYARIFQRYDLMLSPVLSHTTPRLGEFSPTVVFEELIDRLHRYVGFTPLHNVAGAPAVSLPLGESTEGLPIGMQFSAAHGDERTLVEIAYALEAEQPWRRIQD